MKKCPYCGKKLHDKAFKCKKCDAWVDNDTFDKLCDEDVELIKDKNLIIVTPSLITLMLSMGIDKRLRELTKKSKELYFREVLFHTYCYSNALNICAKKKAGMKDLLKKDLNIALILNTFLLIEKILPYKKKFQNKEVIEFGLDVFSQLDKIINEEILSPKFDFDIPPESQVFIAKKMGKVIYEDKNTIEKSLKLYAMFFITMHGFSEQFSSFFIVEEEDFDWKSMMVYKKLRLVKPRLKSWFP